MIKWLVSKIIGTRNERYLRTLRPKLKKCNALEEATKALSDDELREKIVYYKEKVQSGEKTLDDILPNVFAIVREASLRSLGMRPYDVQLLGGMVLHAGKIAEMKTGEGKTLVATLPVVLNALSGKGVHVVTVNDYLAKRDSQWMGKLYNFLGLTVGVVVHELDDDQRKEAYACDITYGTNNEFGFDYLRDNMKFYAEQLVQRGHNYAIVDEVDSILIDEARTPLIISGAVEDSTRVYQVTDLVVRQLTQEEDFTIEEKTKSVMLTDVGVAKCEQMLGLENLYDPSKITILNPIQQALKAHYAFKRDVDYVVNNGEVLIVDEFTGRLMPGRRYSDGLHQALEAKEHVQIKEENQTLASITFQNYFRMYTKLAGMTGTAQTEAVEFNQIYKLETITVPTNMPMIRKDYPDLIYRTQREKYNAIVMAIKELYEKGQPVLVGTISIETSELISNMLKKEGIPHNVLNAKHHEQEAAIVAQAGQKHHVTVATNMAGRGTDIVLGEGVVELGGLHILGTERHESRRIDNQLRGRSGRQGDPGSSRFYLSLEDNLMRIFGSDKLKNLMTKVGMQEGEAIENRMVTRAIESAQKRVEGHNFEIRKTLLDYDNVMNQQREVIYGLRRNLMLLPDLEGVLMEFVDELLDSLYAPIEGMKEAPDAELCEQINTRLIEVCNISRTLPDLTMSVIPSKSQAKDAVVRIFAELREESGPIYGDILRYFLLEALDSRWKDHLRIMDYLREGIGLRGYGQRDPKLEYKREGLERFRDMLFKIHENAIQSLTHVKVNKNQDEENDEIDENEAVNNTPVEDNGETVDLTNGSEENDGEESKQPAKKSAAPTFNLKHNTSSAAMGGDGRKTVSSEKTNEKRSESPSAGKTSETPYTGPRVGRNDPCPCGSGKKFKKCCGKDL